jgi:hypothetical protein
MRKRRLQNSLVVEHMAEARFQGIRHAGLTKWV